MMTIRLSQWCNAHFMFAFPSLFCCTYIRVGIRILKIGLHRSTSTYIHTQHSKMDNKSIEGEVIFVFPFFFSVVLVVVFVCVYCDCIVRDINFSLWTLNNCQKRKKKMFQTKIRQIYNRMRCTIQFPLRGNCVWYSVYLWIYLFIAVSSWCT